LTATWALTDDPFQFAAQAAPLLAARLEHNLLATIAADVRGSSSRGPVLFAVACDGDGEPRAAALRTPPWPLLVIGTDEVPVEPLLERWLERDAPLPGVGGPAESSRAVADAYVSLTGAGSKLAMREAMQSLEQVSAPERPPRGRLREAATHEVGLLIEWERAFRAEAGVTGGDPEPAVRARMERGAAFIWDDEGPVCTVGRARTYAAVARVGPVYTPPEHRRRGYGSAAVAAVAQRALDGDADRCMLLSDLANPTASGVYHRLGFRQFAEWHDYAFMGSGAPLPLQP